jgi:hypothetical protein
MSRPLRGLAAGVLWAVLVLLLTGCNRPTGVVSGTIHVQGKPVSRGLITFLSEVEERDAFNAAIINGTYRTNPIPCGPARIIVVVTPPADANKPARIRDSGDEQPVLRPGSGKSKSLDLSRYHRPDTSGLQIVVKRGENTFDADLKP